MLGFDPMGFDNHWEREAAAVEYQEELQQEIDNLKQQLREIKQSILRPLARMTVEYDGGRWFLRPADEGYGELTVLLTNAEFATRSIEALLQKEVPDGNSPGYDTDTLARR